MRYFPDYCCCCFLYAFGVCLIFLNSPHSAVCFQHETNLQQRNKPNIVIILIDDMGFNDVSFHGSNQVLTPNIDALAYNGIILNKNYVPNLCTPSRATLLTGKYPIHTGNRFLKQLEKRMYQVSFNAPQGTQHSVIINDEPWGLSLQEHLMPEIFRAAGYSTNLVGKWHLGFYRKEMTPLFRGFDHHFGYYSGYIGYYDHTLKMLDRNYTGLDMRRDLRPCPEVSGIYATDLFTQEAVEIINNHNVKKPLFMLLSHLAVHTGNEDNPMEAPEEEIKKFGYISDPKRRKYAAMISRLDESVNQTVKALADRGMLNNTVILLYADNGAPTLGVHANKGSNHPFRGQKASPWEGGIRSAGLMWSPLLNQMNYVSNQAIHAIDWLPTLAAAAGISLPEKLKLDGINIWPTLKENLEPQPRRLLHAYDDVEGYSSYMRGNLKYINGSTSQGKYDTWLGDINQEEINPLNLNYAESVLNTMVNKNLGSNTLTKEMIQKLREQAILQCPFNNENYKQEIYKCEPLKAPCYFNLDKDPCERYNLAKLYPLQVQFLAQEVEEYRIGVAPPAKIAIPDPFSNPNRFEGNWQWWYGTHNSGVKISGSFCYFLLIINILLAFLRTV